MNFRGGFSQKLYVRCLWGPWIRLSIPSQKFGANERKTFLDLAETDAVSYHAIHYKVIQTLINNRLHFSRCYWYKRLYNLAQGIRYIDTVTYTVNSNGLNSGLTFCLLTEHRMPIWVEALPSLHVISFSDTLGTSNGTGKSVWLQLWRND